MVSPNVKTQMPVNKRELNYWLHDVFTIDNTQQQESNTPTIGEVAPDYRR